jgi:hypothetical protein
MSIFATMAQAKQRQAAPPPQPQVLPAAPAPPPPNDTALFLAGMPVPNDSPLAPLTRDPAWIAHARYYEAQFSKLNKTKFQKLHDWQNAFLPESLEQIPVVYYMFSGPDFLYMDQFYPNASTYIMCGKEAIGPAPDPLHMPNIGGALANLQNATKSSLTATYFVTQDMKVDLQSQELKGTLPILYVFIARAGKTIREVSYGSLDSGGHFRETGPGTHGTPGVRISYTDNSNGRQQTVFYFTTDISDGGIGSNLAFMRFCDMHGVGASFLKSSSYLMFEEGFNRVREFILNHSHMIVQDDSGIPIRYFDNRWSVRFFGTYVGPLDIFKQHYQPRLTEIYKTTNPAPFGIGFGYQWDYRKSNLIVAQRQ